MQIVPFGPCPVGSLVVRTRGSSTHLVLVCKATFELAPGTSRLAREQEPLHAKDVPAEGQTTAIRAPADLVPGKRRAEIVLVGHAYAPGGAPVRSLRARLAAHGVDKTIEVHTDRRRTLDGRVFEAGPFTRMSLGWERAAGGAGTTNPVGISDRVPPDMYGTLPMPNLQAAGGRPAAGVPVSFGPIAPSWPDRSDKRGGGGASALPEVWDLATIPEALDEEFFQVAPRDQQMRERIGEVRLVLENLHSRYPHIDTELKGFSRAMVQRPGRGPEVVAMEVDTVWIDTDRGICTVTWRGRIRLSEATEAGTATVGLSVAGGDEEAGAETVMVSSAAKAEAALPFQAGVSSMAKPASVVSLPPKALGGMADRDEAGSGTELGAKAPVGAVLPFGGAKETKVEPPAELPLEKFPLERCAAIAASIARTKSEKGRILEENELDAGTWERLAKHWDGEIGKETRQGKMEMLRAYDEAYVKQLEKERGEITAEDYARITLAEERGMGAEVLREMGLPRGAGMRIERVWQKRAATNQAIGSQIRQRIDELERTT